MKYSIFLFQFSFFQHALNSSDIMCFTDYTHRPVLTDALKAPPEDDNRSISNWYAMKFFGIVSYGMESAKLNFRFSLLKPDFKSFFSQ